MSTPNEPIYEPEKPYKAEQEAARDELFREMFAIETPPAGTFTVFDALDAVREVEPDLQKGAMRMRIDRDKRIEQWGMYKGKMYYRMKDE